MANRLLSKDEILAELRNLDDAAGNAAGYFIGDLEITRKIDGLTISYGTADLLFSIQDFSNKFLRPLIIAPRRSATNPANVVEQITAARGPIYGPFLHNGIVAQGIKAVIRHVPDPDNEGIHWHRLPADVREALDLIAVKISRIVTGDPEYLDNWDDIGGYAKIVADRIRKSKPAKVR